MGFGNMAINTFPLPMVDNSGDMGIAQKTGSWRKMFLIYMKITIR